MGGAPLALSTVPPLAWVWGVGANQGGLLVLTLCHLARRPYRRVFVETEDGEDVEKEEEGGVFLASNHLLGRKSMRLKLGLEW